MSPIPKRNQSAEHLLIEDAQADRRVDNFLIGRLSGVPRSRVYNMIRRGEVRVNGGRVRPDYRLCAGDDLRIPPVARAAPPRGPVSPAEAERLAGMVIYEDTGLLVLNKPAGTAVHGGSGVPTGLIERLRAARPGEPGLQLVHRLDRDTSGCLLVARRPDALRRLHRLLREGAMTKQYVALLKGVLEGGEITVDSPLNTGARRGGERTVTVEEEGRHAVTRFRVIRRFAGATLVNVTIGTGRTHQIRVHAASIGHPVAGDTRYGDRAFNREMRRRGLRRMFLHAGRIRAPAGDGQPSLSVDAPLPPELRTFLAGLGD